MKKILLIGAVCIITSKALLITNVQRLISAKECPFGICKPGKCPKPGDSNKQ